MWQAGRATLSRRTGKTHERELRVKLQGDKNTCQSLTLSPSLLTVMNCEMSWQTFVLILEYLFTYLQTLRLEEHQGPLEFLPFLEQELR